MKKILMVTTTATYANKGRDALKEKGIASEVRKVQGGTAAGCLFGIVIDQNDLSSAGRILDSENVRIISVREVRA